MIDFGEALVRVERYADNGDLHLLLGVVASGHALKAGLGQTTGRGFLVLEERAPPEARPEPVRTGRAGRKSKLAVKTGSSGHVDMAEETAAVEAPRGRALVWLGPALGGRGRADDEAAARGLLWQRTRGLVIGAEETR